MRRGKEMGQEERREWKPRLVCKVNAKTVIYVKLKKKRVSLKQP